MAGNIFPKMRSSHNANAYPANNYYPQNYAATGMQSYRRCGESWQSDLCEGDVEDYALRADSEYANKAIDNTDPGINAALLSERLRCTSSGDTRNCIAGRGVTTPTPTPTPTPTSTPTATPTQHLLQLLRPTPNNQSDRFPVRRRGRYPAK